MRSIVWSRISLGRLSLIEKAAALKTYDGDAFIANRDDARYGLSLDEHIGEIWLSNPESKYNANDEKKRSFLTLWISETIGK
jgi:hypothetical protein